MMKTRRVDRITTQGGQIRLSHVGWIEKTTTVFDASYTKEAVVVV